MSATKRITLQIEITTEEGATGDPLYAAKAVGTGQEAWSYVEPEAVCSVLMDVAEPDQVEKLLANATTAPDPMEELRRSLELAGEHRPVDTPNE